MVRAESARGAIIYTDKRERERERMIIIIGETVKRRPFLSSSSAGSKQANGKRQTSGLNLPAISSLAFGWLKQEASESCVELAKSRLLPAQEQRMSNG